MSHGRLAILKRTEPLRVGFLPVSDCAPLIYASETGLFEKYDLDVQLKREPGWANIRDKISYGQLDAAHAPATLPFLANLGLEADPCACVSGMVLSLQGNAIILSKQLWNQGVHDAARLRELIYKFWRKRTFTFGIPFPFSTQEVVFRRWLATAGIVPEVEVRTVGVPPDQMFPTLKLGYLDGYCVGEPWASLAVQAGVGVCIATSAQLAPLHPEKVLMVRQSFAVGRADEHERLVAALLEACAACEQPENRLLLSETLAHPQYLNAPAECVEAGLPGKEEPEPAADTQKPGDQMIFYRDKANEPGDNKALWLIELLSLLLQQRGVKADYLGRTPVLSNVFRRDIYERAKALVGDNARAKRKEAQLSGV